MSVFGSLVLVVEDETQMRRVLRSSLISNGHRCIEAETAAQALMMASSHNPDLILLDLGLPDGDGIDVTRALRKIGQAPIIVISARGQEDDKVKALDAGADDYLTKPFGIQELLARMRVAYRHVQSKGTDQTETVLTFDTLCVDGARRQVSRNGKPIHLTPIEYKLLTLLATHAGKVLTHRQILKEVWGPQATGQAHYVRVHMAELRKKIEPDPARPRWLTTEPGIGYRFRG